MFISHQYIWWRIAAGKSCSPKEAALQGPTATFEHDSSGNSQQYKLMQQDKRSPNSKKEK